MKKVFIYYSQTGNGDLVADHLKSKGIDIRKVVMKDKIPKSKIGMILTGGFLAGINHKAELIDFNTNIDEYDEIIIGSPIWNGRLSCPINTVLNRLSLDGKKTIFIFYSGSGDSSKVSKKIKGMYPNCKIISIKEPKNNIDQISNYINEI